MSSETEKNEHENDSEQKNMEKDSVALCSSMAVVTLAIVSYNVFVVLYGVFALVALNGERDTYYKWKRLVKIFYFICLVIIILILLGFTISMIMALSVHMVWFIWPSVFMIFVSILELIFITKSYLAISELYTSTGSEKVTNYTEPTK